MSAGLWSVNEKGFLPTKFPLQRLQYPLLRPFEEFLDVLPAKISGGRIKDEVMKLPALSPDDLHQCLHTDEEFERALLLYAFISHGYINGSKGGKAHQEETPSLPARLAVPWYWLSEKIGRPVILTYATCVLYNWKIINPYEEVSIDNITVSGRFLGIVDEEWFFKTHVMIEYYGGPIIYSMKKILYRMESLQDSHEDLHSLSFVLSSLADMTAAFQKINAVLKQLIVSCDPYIFFSALRMFLGSYKDGKGRTEGLIFEGVTELEGKPQNLIGASGAQSTLLPCLDAFLGIRYENNSVLDKIVHGMLNYMPKEHRRFCLDIPVGALRIYIEKFQLEDRGFSELRMAYDQLIDEIAYAAKYIVNEVERRNGEMVLGTGGTPFMKYLTMHLKTTKRMQFKFKYTPTGYIRGAFRNAIAHLPEPLRGRDSRIISLEPQIYRERRRKLALKLLLGLFLILSCYYYLKLIVS